MVTMMISRHKKSRAFTLTELAIVLAVVGGIVGLIWAAAADVSMSNKVRAANVELVYISHTVRGIFVEQGGVRGQNSTLTPALDRLKAFPLEMRQDPTVDAGILFHPWSQKIDTSTSLGDVQVSASDCVGTLVLDDKTPEPCFSVLMMFLTQKACVQILAATTMTGTGLQSVTINGTNLSLPIDSNTATTNCSVTTPANTVQWVYTLRDKP